MNKKIHTEKVRVELPTATVIVVDDRVASGARENRAGHRAVEDLGHYAEVSGCAVVHEVAAEVTEALEAALAAGVDLILTVGGTGLRSRSVTPECTEALISLRAQGLETQILLKGLESTTSAGLSRGLVGVIERSGRRVFIVNAAGSHGAVGDAVAVVGPLLPSILEQMC